LLIFPSSGRNSLVGFAQTHTTECFTPALDQATGAVPRSAAGCAEQNSGDGLGAAAATGGRIDVKRLIVLRPIKNEEVRLDDNETRIPDARRADVTGVGAWVPSRRGFGIAKILKKRHLDPCQGFPVDVGSKSSVAGEKGS
jgi:hypothetical protein